jgi:hypothetical protein
LFLWRKEPRELFVRFVFSLGRTLCPLCVRAFQKVVILLDDE